MSDKKDAKKKPKPKNRTSVVDTVVNAMVPGKFQKTLLDRTTKKMNEAMKK